MPASSRWWKKRRVRCVVGRPGPVRSSVTGVGREEDAGEGADLRDLRVGERAARRPSAKRVAVALELGVGGVVELRQDGEAGGGGERVPAQGAGLVDGAERRELVHDVGAAAERGERETAADDLAEHREVGRDAEARPARRPGPRRNPVMTSSQTSSAPASVQRRRRPARKPSAGGDQAHVGGDRLDEHRRELGAVAVERVVERGVVVVGDDDGVGHRALGDARPNRAGRGWRRRCRRRRAGRRRGRGSSPANFRIFGPDRSRRARGGSRSSPPRCPTTTRRTLSTDGTRAAMASASSTSRSVGAPYDVPSAAARCTASTTTGMRVAEDRGAPRLHVVDVATAVGVEQVRALAAGDEERLAADRRERPHRRVDPAGDRAPARAFEQRAHERRSAISRAK